jgi:hypothetical protein
MRTHAECEGVGPSRMKSWCQFGGETWEFGGAVMVHTLPLHENAGKMVRLFMTLPCVLGVAVHRMSVHGARMRDR